MNSMKFKLNKANLIATITLATTVAASPFIFANGHTDVKNLAATTNIPSVALKKALSAYDWAKQHGKVTKKIITIIDFDEPSTEKRLWVVNLETGKVLYNTLVAQGKGSGRGKMATKFSNVPNSKASSLGVYVTNNTFNGEHGRDLRLTGLEKGLNNNAMKRAIVVHSAWYATPSFVKQHGYLGHSFGCFAIDPNISKQVISTIKDGSVIFAYSKQLDTSNYF